MNKSAKELLLEFAEPGTEFTDYVDLYTQVVDQLIQEAEGKEQ